MPPALTPMDAAPHATLRTKKKRKKTTPAAAPAAATDDASTATPTPTTAPATKKGKMTGKKKSAEPINLRTSPMFVSTTDLAMHCVKAIAHLQKWVDGNAEKIIGNVADKPTSGRQWYQKGSSGERIAPGNPDFADMSPLAAFVHMIPPEQLDLMLELTSERLVAKAKKELILQELLRWIGVCMLIASINFRSNRHKLWEGGGAASKYLPSYDPQPLRRHLVCRQVVSSTTRAARRHVVGAVSLDVDQRFCHQHQQVPPEDICPWHSLPSVGLIGIDDFS